MVTLVNLEPAPASANLALCRFDSAVTGPNGRCLPAFCDDRPDRLHRPRGHGHAGRGGAGARARARARLPGRRRAWRSPTWTAGLPPRTDHDDPAPSAAASASTSPSSRPGDPPEANGPVYPWRSLRECQEAPVTASHFRFARVRRTKYEYNVVPFEGARVLLDRETSWPGGPTRAGVPGLLPQGEDPRTQE